MVSPSLLGSLTVTSVFRTLPKEEKKSCSSSASVPTPMPSTATTAESDDREPPSYECRLGALESDVIDVSDASESLRSLPRARLTGDMGISDALGVGRLVDLMSVGDVGGASVAPSNVNLVLTRGGDGRANPSIAVGEREESRVLAFLVELLVDGSQVDAAGSAVQLQAHATRSEVR